MKNFFAKFLLILLFSCEKGPQLLNEPQLLEMARKVDPNIEILYPSEENPKVNCYEYGDGCIYGMTLKFKNLTILAIKFDSIKNAQESAFKFNAYVKNNWVFDYVKGEPLLEEIFEKEFKAITISRPDVERVPYKTLKQK